MKMSKIKTVALLLACVLVFGVAAGGTIAWLTDETPDVVNTFTVGDINIDLKEHELGTDANGQPVLKENETTRNVYAFVPGDVLPKDPFVTVGANSEACFLFLKVEEMNNSIEADSAGKYDAVQQIIHYEVEKYDETRCPNGWKQVVIDGAVQTGYYYCQINAADAEKGTSRSVLMHHTGDYSQSGDTVQIDAGVTKEMVLVINGEDTKPQLIFTAAAVQSDNLPGTGDYTEAWKLLPDGFKPTSTP